MARTLHHRNQKTQHQGRDLWSRRPLSQQAYCSINKLLSRQRERAINRQLVHNVVKNEYFEE